MPGPINGTIPSSSQDDDLIPLPDAMVFQNLRRAMPSSVMRAVYGHNGYNVMNDPSVYGDPDDNATFSPELVPDPRRICRTPKSLRVQARRRKLAAAMQRDLARNEGYVYPPSFPQTPNVPERRAQATQTVETAVSQPDDSDSASSESELEPTSESELNFGSMLDEKDLDEKEPDEKEPEEKKPDEKKPEENKPDEPKPDEPKPDEPKPDEPKPVEPKPVEPKPDEAGVAATPNDADE